MNTNIYNFTIDTFSPYQHGGAIEKQEEKQNIRYGENMEEQLQRYKHYLCGEHSNHNTIDNKITSTRILLQQTQGTINTDTIQSFKAWANQHYHHNSRNNRINAWNEFLRWYTGDKETKLQMKHIGFIETNQYALNENEIQKILNETTHNPLEHLVLLCLFDGALRPAEIINIRLDRRDGNKLYLDETKTGDKRIILSPALQTAWTEYQKIRPQPQPGNEHYFILKSYHHETGKKYMDTHAINDMLYSIGKRVGLTHKLTPYTIRRTSATLRQCKYSTYYMGDVKLVKTLFRHKDITTTLRYDRTTDLDIERYFDEQATINQPKPTINQKHPTINHRKPTINRPEPIINRPEATINEKHTDINLIYNTPQSTTPTEENDNFSFSFTFFNEPFGVTGFPPLKGTWGSAGPVIGPLGLHNQPPHNYYSYENDLLNVINDDWVGQQDSSWISDAVLGWSKLDTDSALIQPQFCNTQSNICFSINNTFTYPSCCFIYSEDVMNTINWVGQGNEFLYRK